MDRKVFKILAKGCLRQNAYEYDLRNAIDKVTRKYDGTVDFLGLPCDNFTFMNAVFDAIKVFDTYETFDYFVHECNSDWDKFNRAIEWEEGEKTKHPDCHSLDDLYDYILLENSQKKSAEEN